MKKFLISAVCSLALLPVCSVATALDNLFTSGIYTGPCGEPPALTIKNPSFCTCLLNKSTEVCQQQKQPPSVCSRVHQSYTHVPNNDYKAFCLRWRNMFPKDANGQSISMDECAQDLAYYNAQCK